MNSKALGDPLTSLSRPERRKWRQAGRRALRDHDAQQLTTLRSLAATGGGLTSLICQDSAGYATSAELVIAGKRIRAGRVHRPTLSALTQALGCMPTVPLLAASRYGPYWVLTFELATAPLAVLADRLSILPDRHCSSGPLAAPTAPVDGRHQSIRLAGT
jgi:hypothetical protein